jgi:hypothetical protein
MNMVCNTGEAVATNKGSLRKDKNQKTHGGWDSMQGKTLPGTSVGEFKSSLRHHSEIVQ